MVLFINCSLQYCLLGAPLLPSLPGRDQGEGTFLSPARDIHPICSADGKYTSGSPTCYRKMSMTILHPFWFLHTDIYNISHKNFLFCQSTGSSRLCCYSETSCCSERRWLQTSSSLYFRISKLIYLLCLTPEQSFKLSVPVQPLAFLAGLSHEQWNSPQVLTGLRAALHRTTAGYSSTFTWAALGLLSRLLCYFPLEQALDSNGVKSSFQALGFWQTLATGPSPHLKCSFPLNPHFS